MVVSDSKFGLHVNFLVKKHQANSGKEFDTCLNTISASFSYHSDCVYAETIYDRYVSS